MSLDIPVLEAARVRLRPYRLADFEDYARMWQEPAVVRFIGGVPFTREQSWTRFLRQIGLWHHLGFGFWAIEDRDTGRFCGECGFHDLQRGMTPSLDGTMEAGWGLVPEMQGQGVAEEAMRAALGWAAAHGPRDRLTAIVEPSHGASLRVAEKLGFREFARTTYHERQMVMLERSAR